MTALAGIILSGEKQWDGKVSHEEAEGAGDVVARCVFWDHALPVCVSHSYQVLETLSTSVLYVCVYLSFRH